ncbi:hypothetical protein [Roseixanthobacter glucoisosaccharinicivorans]|uniref:hypothetical protein n=1 Tax=Roseixanthobacter glucoisosaccharinicivorans TaxID=3119923 RepID=UPI0037294C54
MEGTTMGSFSRISPAPSSLRLVIGTKDREVASLDEAMGFLHEQDADALGEFLLSGLDADAPEALVAFRNRLEMMRAAL